MSGLRAFPAMVLAELTKIRRRGFGTVAVVVAVVHGVLVLAAMVGIRALLVWQTPEGQRDDLNVFDGLQAGEWTLFTLCLPVMGVVILAVVSELFAGEYAQRTYSLLLIRPVPRWQVFAAKFVAAIGFVCLVLLAVALLSSVLGLVGFGAARGPAEANIVTGVEADPGFFSKLWGLAVWYVRIGLSMLPVVALTAFFAVVTRSTALAVTYSIILWLIDVTVLIGLQMAFWWRGNEIFQTIADFTMTASRSPMFTDFLCKTGVMLPGLDCAAAESATALQTALPYLLQFGYTALFAGAAVAIFTFQDVE